MGTELPAINVERLNDLHKEFKVLGSGTNVESSLHSIAAASVTAYKKLNMQMMRVLYVHDLGMHQVNPDMNDCRLNVLPECTDDCFKVKKKIKCNHHIRRMPKSTMLESTSSFHQHVCTMYTTMMKLTTNKIFITEIQGTLWMNFPWCTHLME